MDNEVCGESYEEEQHDLIGQEGKKLADSKPTRVTFANNSQATRVPSTEAHDDRGNRDRRNDRVRPGDTDRHTLDQADARANEHNDRDRRGQTDVKDGGEQYRRNGGRCAHGQHE
ncbi:hypothetical protein D9M72_543870 [compost metagenome]